MELKLSVSEPKTIDGKMMKKIILWAITLLIFGWSAFQLIVTPWGELPGKIIFESNRASSKWGSVTMLHEMNRNKIFYQEVGLRCKWSPDGQLIAAIAGPQIIFLNGNGDVVQSIKRPENIGTFDIAWLPDSNRVMTIEYDRQGSRKGYESTGLFIYDGSSGERIPFYDKNDYLFRAIAISRAGKIVFTGAKAGKEHLDEPFSLYEIDPMGKKISFLKKTSGSSFFNIEFVNNGSKLAFSGNLKPFGHLISPWVLGVYDLKTGFTRYISLWAGDIRQMTVVKDSKYLITAEGEGNAVVLYKRSLLGGFKLPIMKPEKLAYLNGFPSQDQYPDWHS